jgi:hypothetical protein
MDVPKENQPILDLLEAVMVKYDLSKTAAVPLMASMMGVGDRIVWFWLSGRAAASATARVAAELLADIHRGRLVYAASPQELDSH